MNFCVVCRSLIGDRGNFNERKVSRAEFETEWLGERRKLNVLRQLPASISENRN
jgi:hypothetical protein